MTAVITVNKDHEWGKLVKSWATGLNYFKLDASGNPADEKIPQPTTLAELKTQCTQHGITITIPPTITKLDIVQMKSDTLLLRLPAKDQVLAVEAELMKPAAKYTIPHFYDAFYGTAINAPTKEKKLELQACRLGDYSIAQCA